MYRSEDIRNLSRLHQPSVCGYVTSDPGHIIPDGVKTTTMEEHREEGEDDHDKVEDNIHLKAVKNMIH